MDAVLEIATGHQQAVLEVLLALLFAASPTKAEQLGALWKEQYRMYGGMIAGMVRARLSFLEILSANGSSIASFAWPLRYLLLGFVGEGGFGKVFRVFDWDLRRCVALKLLRPDRGKDEAAVRAFNQEARSIARFRHASIVGVHDVLRDVRGVPHAIVMELLPGCSLAEILRRQVPLEPERAALLAAGVADALAVAHGADVIHRDLKPSNIVIQDGGAPCVIDFGLALLAGDDGARRTVGTTGYAAPEQLLDSNSVRCSADVWSLGVLLYAMLSGGRLPYEGHDAHVRLLGGDSPEPLSSRNRRVPLALERICMRCLRHDEGKRPSAAALSHHLHTWLRFGDPTPRIHRYIRRSLENTETITLPTGDREMARGIKFAPLLRDQDQRVLSLREILAAGNSFQIVGPSGIGKSAASRWIERWHARRWLTAWRSGDCRTESLPLPVYLDLACVAHDIIDAVVAKLTRHGIKCDVKTVAEWLRAGQIVLILDGAESYPRGRDALAVALGMLRDDCGGDVRIVVNSRGGVAGGDSGLPRFRLELLGDTQILAILGRKLGTDRAHALFARLAASGSLGPFRLPVMAWFLALAHDESEDDVGTNPGRLYSAVIERRLDRFDDSGAIADQLQSIASAMVGRNSVTLDEGFAAPQNAKRGTERAGTLDASQWKRLTETGFLRREGGTVRFQHDSLRDYFFATAVADRLAPRAAFREACEYMVPTIWEHYLGLVSEADSEIFLKLLLRRVRNSFRLSYFWPWTRADALLTLLRGLSNSPFAFARIKSSLVRSIERYGRGFLAHFGPLPRHSDFASPSQRLARWFCRNVSSTLFDDDLSVSVMKLTDGRIWSGENHHDRAWQQFVALVGRLGSSESTDYVERQMQEQRNWRPLAFLRAAMPIEQAIAAIAADLQSPGLTGGAHLGLTGLVMSLPADTVVPILRKNAQGGGQPPLEVVLPIMSAIVKDCFELFMEEAAIDKGWARQDGVAHSRLWCDFLCELVLGPHPKLRDDALSVLKALNNMHLPNRAWRTFLRNLRSADDEEVGRSIWPLVYSPVQKRPVTVRALEQLVKRTETLSLAIDALYALGFLNHASFIRTLCATVIRFGDAVVRKEILALTRMLCTVTGLHIATVEIRSAAALLAGLGSSHYGVVQMCASALPDYPFDAVVDALVARFDVDPIAETEALRVASLEALMRIAEAARRQSEFGPRFCAALTDPSPEVRRAALLRAKTPIFGWQPLLRSEAGMQLLRTCCNDADSGVQKLANDLWVRFEMDGSRDGVQ